MEKIKLAMVSYINTIPFIKGIEEDPFLSERIEIILDYPANCAQLIKNKDVDGGLLPIGALGREDEENIFTDFCIGADGEVDTVALFSQRPLDEVETVFLDYQSRTSVQLVQLLNYKYWHYPFQFKAAHAGFEKQMPEKEAILLIGDRVFQYENKFKYKTDLALAWKEATELPFVFAVWTGNEKARLYEQQLNAAFRKGLQKIPSLYNTDYKISEACFEDYLSNKIDYHYEASKQKAFRLFKKWTADLKEKNKQK